MFKEILVSIEVFMFDLFNHLHIFLCFTKILRIYEREFFDVKIFKCVVIEKVYTKFVYLFKVIMENGNICMICHCSSKRDYLRKRKVAFLLSVYIQNWGPHLKGKIWSHWEQIPSILSRHQQMQIFLREDLSPLAVYLVSLNIKPDKETSMININIYIFW